MEDWSGESYRFAERLTLSSPKLAATQPQDHNSPPPSTNSHAIQDLFTYYPLQASIPTDQHTQEQPGASTSESLAPINLAIPSRTNTSGLDSFYSFASFDYYDQASSAFGGSGESTTSPSHLSEDGL